MSAKTDVLPVTVDKSHLITIGERLYSHSVELIRELVNNAYDADATIVHVTISETEVIVEDNGSGMDKNGLIQYFKIGTPSKKLQPRSPVFKRARIGQFGIGKFATLSACEAFKVTTQKNDFMASVTFDKTFWQSLEEDWNLPLEILKPDKEQGNGTTVVLSKLKKKFDVELIRQRLLESVPLKAPNFEVYLNGVKLLPKSLSGHRLPVLEGSNYGPIYGEVVIVSASHAKNEEFGIEVKIKQVTIKRELFGIETWGKQMSRIKGEINADFLPITSDRGGFIVDSPEYIEFQKIMNRVMQDIKGSFERIVGKRETMVAKRAMKEALARIEQALNIHPDLSPFGSLPVSDGASGVGEAAKIVESKEEAPQIAEEETKKKKERKKKAVKSKRSTVSRLSPNAVVQRLKIGASGVSCCLDHFGYDGPEVFTEGSIIYINRDHLLYQREAKKRDTHILNVARLIAQEISLMKNSKEPRQAFEHQSIILRDAFST